MAEEAGSYLSLYEALAAVQQELNAPKSQRNTFGNYNYRSCEDILEAVKPLLEKHGLVMVIVDELVNIGDRYYIKATASISSIVDPSAKVDVSGYAREEEHKKGMDGSQVTGASSSYARKYALNGLFLIDDSKDSDATNTHGKETSSSGKSKPEPTKPKAAAQKSAVSEKPAPHPIKEIKLSDKDKATIISSFEKIGVEIWDLEKAYGEQSTWTKATKAAALRVYNRIVSTTDQYSAAQFIEEAKEKKNAS